MRLSDDDARLLKPVCWWITRCGDIKFSYARLHFCTRFVCLGSWNWDVRRLAWKLRYLVTLQNTERAKSKAIYFTASASRSPSVTYFISNFSATTKSKQHISSVCPERSAKESRSDWALKICHGRRGRVDEMKRVEHDWWSERLSACKQLTRA